MNTNHPNYSDISKALETVLIKLSPKHPISDVYKYSVLPPGKLFRPLLFVSCLKDHKFSAPLSHSNITHFCAFLEIHHAYTLIHDDMPCMDDDDVRRGKASVHKAFGEWKALIAGDALLNMSYALISKVSSEYIPNLLKISTWALGAKGLIHGQVLDLEESTPAKTKSFSEILEIHTLKTGRLIQVALLGALVLSENYNYKKAKEFLRIGSSIGIIFQLLDDLTELSEEKLSKHEQSINPWINHKELSFRKTCQELELIKNIKYSEISGYLDNYFGKIEKILIDKQSTILTHIQIELEPIMSLLNRTNIA